MLSDENVPRDPEDRPIASDDEKARRRRTTIRHLPTLFQPVIHHRRYRIRLRTKAKGCEAELPLFYEGNHVCADRTIHEPVEALYRSIPSRETTIRKHRPLRQLSSSTVSHVLYEAVFT